MSEPLPLSEETVEKVRANPLAMFTADDTLRLVATIDHWRKRAEEAEAEVVFQRDANANNVAQWSERCQKVENLRHRLEGALRQIVAGHIFPGTVAREALEGQP